MGGSNHLKKIAIVGASGNVGAAALKYLLASTTTTNITLITRSSSSSSTTATFPTHPSITSIQKGSYQDPAFLASALEGQDALILALGFMAMDHQKPIIEAAAKAGVRWILPTEYSNDGENEAMVDAVPLFWPKREARKLIEALAGEKKEEVQGRELNWIGVATNPWTEFSLQYGGFGIKIPEREAVLYSDAGPFNTSTLDQVGKGIAALLSLPLTNPSNPRKSLQHYANKFVYISSFLTTQRALFDAALQATETTEAEWKVESATLEERIVKAREEVRGGNLRAGADLVFAFYMGVGKGGDYEVKAREDRGVLGLEEGDLDFVMTKVVKMEPPEPYGFEP